MENFKPAFDGDIPENLQKALKDIVKTFDNEERDVRERQLRELKRADNFWHGIQYSIWDESIGDFRSPNMIFESQVEQDVDPNIFSKIKNIYKAHGESTIAALTTGIPYVRYFPYNAENGDDIQTAKAYTKLEELIQRHNKAQLIFIHSLFILFNQNFVAAYNYPHSDKKYGSVQQPVNGLQPVTNTTHICPSCGAPLGNETQEGEPYDPNEIPADNISQPDVPDVPLSDVPAGPESMDMSQGDNPNPEAAPQVECPSCGQMVEPYSESQTNQVPVILRYDDIDKIRECIEVYGPLNVMIPHYVKHQKDTPILGLDGEMHVSQSRELYSQIASKITASTDQNTYETWSRTPTAYAGDSPRGLVTVRRRWLRPFAFNVLDNRDQEVADLKTMFPDGCFCTFVNDEFAEAHNEDLDTRWTVTYSPLSNTLHADPLGQSLMPIQEITNELLNLNVQSIQYGIPETFADPAVLDFESYQKVESGPGLVFPAKPSSGKSLQDAFFTNKVATLSKESMEFGESLNQDAQFVSGSFPSIYGGPQSGGGQTAAEYSMSRAQALQRLGLTWKILSVWWADVMGKSIASFINNMLEDEHFVKQQGDSYQNVWIRQVELDGKVGNIQPDVDEQFPVSWAQKREVLLDLIKLQSDDINQFLFLPANRSQIAAIIGLTDFDVPGVIDENKQLSEIMEMLQASAVPPQVDPNTGQPAIDPNTGQPMQGQSSVPVDPDLDDHEMHADTCKSWLNGDAGQELKKRAPEIYMNIFLHFKEHVAILQQRAAQAQAEQMQMQQQQAQQNSNMKMNEQDSNNRSKAANNPKVAPINQNKGAQ